MKTLSDHIQESFAPIKEYKQTVIENLNDNQEEVVNEDKSVEKKKCSDNMKVFNRELCFGGYSVMFYRNFMSILK